jgi:hypothetical protein
VLETKARKNPVISDAMHKSPFILPQNCPTFWDVTGEEVETLGSEENP